MGYDVDQFEGSISEEYLCAICTGVLADPLTTHCDHLFCSECIHDWLRENPTCPIDRCHLRICMLKPAPRVVRNLIARLPIYCDYAAEGCPDCVPLESYLSHLEQCPFNPSRLVKCKLWCKRTMSLRAMKSHNCINELIEQVTAQQNELEQLRNERKMLTFAVILLILLYFFCPMSTLLLFVPVFDAS